jgi:hypothetical protein
VAALALLEEMELFLGHHQEKQEMVVMDFSFQHLLDHLLVCLLLHH